MNRTELMYNASPHVGQFFLGLSLRRWIGDFSSRLVVGPDGRKHGPQNHQPHHAIYHVFHIHSKSSIFRFSYKTGGRPNGPPRNSHKIMQ